MAWTMAAREFHCDAVGDLKAIFKSDDLVLNGFPTTAASKMLADFVPIYDAKIGRAHV